MNRQFVRDLAIACVLVAIGISSRLLPHPPNFTAVGAVTLFAGFYMSRRWMMPVVTLGTLIIGDIVIGAYDLRLMAVVYAASLLPLAFRSVLRRRLAPGRMIGCSLIGSAAFFVITNSAVWLFSDWYSHDWSGLVSCLAAGVPFFRYTCCGDLLFSCVLFGGYAVARQTAARLDQAVRAWGSRIAFTAPKSAA